MYYTYLLRCGDDSLYAGITTDPERRLAEHRKGGRKGARYTRYRSPLSMAAVWESPDRAAASKLEARLKKAAHGVKEKLAAHPELLDELIELPEGTAYTVAPRPADDQAEAALR